MTFASYILENPKPYYNTQKIVFKLFSRLKPTNNFTNFHSVFRAFRLLLNKNIFWTLFLSFCFCVVNIFFLKAVSLDFYGINIRVYNTRPSVRFKRDDGNNSSHARGI
jgi:hypothetical protein